MSPQICPLCPFKTRLSRLTFPSCPVLVVLSQMSYPNCPTAVVPSCLSCPSCAVFAVITILSVEWDTVNLVGRHNFFQNVSDPFSVVVWRFRWWCWWSIIYLVFCTLHRIICIQVTYFLIYITAHDTSVINIIHLFESNSPCARGAVLIGLGFYCPSPTFLSQLLRNGKKILDYSVGGRWSMLDFPRLRSTTHVWKQIKRLFMLKNCA